MCCKLDTKKKKKKKKTEVVRLPGFTRTHLVTGQPWMSYLTWFFSL